MSTPVMLHREKAMKEVVIDPVTRVEGHGKVTIIIDANGHVERTRLQIVEFRGFERFVQGRPYWEAPVVVQRLCGICPVSHHLAAAKAMDVVVGVGPEGLSPTAEKMRRLMHYGQMLQSHALHFFYLCSPDLLFGFDSDVLKRNIIAVAAEYPDIARQGIMLRRYGQEIIKATAGKRIHGTGAIPGGINKNLSVEQRDIFLKEIDQIIEWSLGAVELVKKVHAQ
ncbi:MAG: Ni/Fe hydrogenase subunit alpha, partial [Deltaproteobacteria bacterium]